MNVIAVAHDPGGANAVAATVVALREMGANVEAYAKGPAMLQFQRMDVKYAPIPEKHDNLFVSWKADMLLRGTSLEDSFEHEATLWAQQQRIPDVAILDYWANYLKRFQRSDQNGNSTVLPDFITAIDDMCVEEMIADQIPHERICLVGQPYFAWLSKRPRPLRNRVKKAAKILFASQPDANELPILEMVIAVLCGHQQLEQFQVRFHPRQKNESESLRLLEASGLPFTVDRSENTLEMLGKQDAVLGISSVILIEAALLGIPAASLATGKGNMLKTNEYGVTVPINSPKLLRHFLENLDSICIASRFGESQRDADRRAAELCFTLQQGRTYVPDRSLNRSTTRNRE